MDGRNGRKVFSLMHSLKTIIFIITILLIGYFNILSLQSSSAGDGVQPGDMISLTLPEDADFNGLYTVDNLGTIDLKFVGKVKIVGQRQAEIERTLKKAFLEKYFKKATPGVTMISLQRRGVMVVGAVFSEKIVLMNEMKEKNLLGAIMAAGGVRPGADLKNVKLIKNGQKSPLGMMAPGEIVDVSPLLLQGAAGKTIVSPVVLEGDMIVVPGMVQQELGVKVVINGEVGAPGPYVFSSEDATLMKALLKAGGFGRWANSEKTKIVRYNLQGEREEIIVDGKKLLKEGAKELDVPLKDGDTIIVPESSIRFF